MEDKKVLLGISGGVDSAVSAILLKEKGYDITGITLKLHEEESSSYQDAKNVCDSIGIEHVIADYTKEFRKYVIDDFIDKYSKCLTPNPCIECNKYLKFGVMFEKAKELGCKYVATGHYAKTEYSDKYKRWVLKKSDSNKDQSYVLWKINKEYLEYILFPLADFKDKAEIRQIASDNNLEIANKKDSEDICFIPNGDYKEFLEKNSNISPKVGDIVHTSGVCLGKHKGMYNYTIGQRRGLGVSYKSPLFVVGFDKEKNQVIVGEEDKLYKKEMYVSDINLLLVDELIDKMEVTVKVRYKSKEEKATIEMVDKDTIKVTFENPVARITPGQSAVFYLDDIVVGGGIIK